MKQITKNVIGIFLILLLVTAFAGMLIGKVTTQQYAVLLLSINVILIGIRYMGHRSCNR